jgi:ADP-ribose pyrophosphatase YjhB (NUDIX family)
VAIDTILRHTARIIVVSPRNTFLLMMTKAPDSSGFSRWITPGGGVDPGESYREAAARELFEETGRHLPLSVEPVWTYGFGVSWDQANHNRGYSEYFVAFSEAEFAVSNEFWTPEEHHDVTASQWWGISELENSADPYEPVSLPELFHRVLAQHRRP